MIKAVLFDLDGVLTLDATGSESICNYVCKTAGVDKAAFKEEYGKYNRDLLYGKTKHEDVWDKICRGLGKEISLDVLVDSFVNTPVDARMVDLAWSLKAANLKLGMITDNKKDRIDKIVEHNQWGSLFDAVLVSAQVGSGKEYEEIFDKALKKLKLNAEDCVFIDNQEKNLVVPEKMGMKIIFYNHEKKNVPGLISQLKDLGIRGAAQR